VVSSVLLIKSQNISLQNSYSGHKCPPQLTPCLSPAGIVSTVFKRSAVSYYPSLQMSTAASILPLQSIRNSSKWISITEQWLAQINHHKSASLDCHLWESNRDLWDHGGTSPITWLSEAETMERGVWGGCLSRRRHPSYD